MHLTHDGTSGTKRASEGLITCSRTYNNRLCSIYPWRSNVGKASEAREQVCVRVACSGEIGGPRWAPKRAAAVAGHGSPAGVPGPTSGQHRYGLLFSREEVSVVRIYSQPSYTHHTRRTRCILAPSRVSPARQRRRLNGPRLLMSAITRTMDFPRRVSDHSRSLMIVKDS